MWNSRSLPGARPPRRSSRPAGTPYDDRPKTQAGSANSASIGASGSRRGPSTQAVEVPPAAAVRDEVEDRRRAPFGLGDRLVRAAGDQVRLAERAVRSRSAPPAAGSRPTACPGGPTRARPGGAPSGDEPRRGEEVRARDEDARVALAVERRRRRSRLTGSPPRRAWSSRTARNRRRAGVEPQVGVAPRALRRDRRPGRRRPGSSRYSRPSAKFEKTTTPPATMYDAAAVLVDPGPDVERRRASGRRSRRPARGRTRTRRPPSAGRPSSQYMSSPSIQGSARPIDVADEVVDPDRRRRQAPYGGDGAARSTSGRSIRSRAARTRRTRPARRSSARARCPAPPA